TMFIHERESVAVMMKRLYDRFLTTSTGGNVSLRLDAHTVCITGGSSDKSLLTKEEVGVVTLSNNNLTPTIRLSSETEMHLSIYQSREDVKAIIHAHPLYATSFSALKEIPRIDLIGESFVVLKEVAFVAYEQMGTKALASKVSSALKKCDVALLENHGVVSVGSTLLEAFDKLEVLEQSAHMTLITEMMESLSKKWKVSPLTESAKKDLS
ncbi:MAG: class II aldolase/adducin family protein, partial [Sphaerochaetaceae bacterium]